MIYILLLTLFGANATVASVTHAFPTQAACETAADGVRAQAKLDPSENVKGFSIVCVPVSNPVTENGA